MPNESLPRRVHRYADRLDRPLRALVRRAPPLEKAWIAVLDGIVARQPDRAYLRKTILPALVRSRPARLLFIGVRGYTRSYEHAFRRAATEFWTSDIDLAAARYGAPGRHVIADVRTLDQAFGPGFFDLVVMNGVFGWGVDDPADMDRALQATGAVLKSGGLLLLGWNSDRSVDPDTLPGIAVYEPTAFAGLPPRKAFPDVTHVYAWYRIRRR